jgi:two-component system phosphate regulon response regulator PhoB
MNKVLVIEDNIGQALKLKVGLEEQNYQVTIAATGNEAISRLKETQPALIILDAFLPDSDGVDFCKSLKTDFLTRSIPIIMYSNDNKLKNMVRAYEAGIDYFIVKEEDNDKTLLMLADSLLYRRSRRPMTLSA